MFYKTSIPLKISKVASLTTLTLEKETKKPSEEKIASIECSCKKKEKESILEKKDTDNFLYFVARAIDADIPNGNGDYFPFEEIEKAYPTFVGKGLYLNHDSDKAEKAVGKIIDAYLVKDELAKRAWVECICKIDKIAHPDIARQVQVGVIDAVSMGCTCETAVCSVCDTEMHTKDDFCDHMKTGLLRKFQKKTGEEITCYSINRGLNFNELSLVNIPADPDAKIHKIIAQKVCGLQQINLEKLAGVLNDLSEDQLEKLNTILDFLLEE